MGFEDEAGFRRRRQHGSNKRATRRRSPSASRARDPGGDDPEEPELPRLLQDNGEGKVDYRDLKRLLTEIRNDNGEVEKRPRAKSPGQTPKSSIQRNLARLGMLDSPARDELPLLEEFFSQFAEGKELGLTEEEVRENLARERGLPLRELTAALLRQERGQKGLTKFLRAWQRGGATATSPSSLPHSSTAPSWDLVEAPALSQTPPSTKSSDPSPQPLRIGVPAIYGIEDRKAGAAHPGGDGAFDEIAPEELVFFGPAISIRWLWVTGNKGRRWRMH